MAAAQLVGRRQGSHIQALVHKDAYDAALPILEREGRKATRQARGHAGIKYRSGAELVGRSTDAAPAGIELLLPGAGATPVAFQTKTAREGVIELGPAKVGSLTLRWRIMQKTPSLVERTLEVTAEAAQQFAIAFPLDVVWDGEFASFTGSEKARTQYDTVRGSAKTETFPVAMVRTSQRVFGIVADSPGLWDTALGLDDPEKTIESQRAVFWTRMDYEDNSQYYLIWAVLMKRAGGTVNEPLARRAYEFLRRHEKDGVICDGGVLRLEPGRRP